MHYKNMYKRFLLVLFSTLLFSCSGSDKVVIPNDVLQVEKMAEVMVDIHLMEAAMNINAANTDKFNTSLRIDIFKKHNITKEQYDKSYDFYTKNPEQLGEVYQMVLNSLSRLQAEVVNGK